MHFNKLDKYDNFKWKLLEGASLEGKYDMPVLQPAYQIPHDLVCFHMAKSEKEAANCWFHFYEDDYHFERVWNRPSQYLPIFQRFDGGISPDFSIYLDMPRAQQIWNCWRNRVLAYWLQANGINIVPNVGWGDDETFKWAFDGLPENSVLAITTQGCLRDGVCKCSLVNGIHELIKAKHPTTIFVYGKFPDIWRDRFSVPVIAYPTYSEQKWGGE